MINVVNVEERPACILFGQPVRGGQQAAWFSESEIDAARKAKNAKTLASLAPVPPELDEMVKGLARGRVEGGQVVLAKAAPDAYAKLLAATAAQRRGNGGQATAVETAKPVGNATIASSEGKPEAAAAGALSSVTATGDGWAQLKVGDLVLARYSPDEGWWGARILKIEGDAFTLAWIDETEALARRPRAQLALVHPKLL